MKTLDECALETTTDRSSRYHDYCRTYDKLFQHKKHKPVVLLEQGVLSGDGLKMWDKWFTHPDTRIYGIDIHPEWFDANPFPRIRTFAGSQSDPNFLRMVIEETGPVDICIDDAGHFGEEQIVAFNTLWQFVKPGGFYTCEDMHTAWHPQHNVHGNIQKFFTEIADDMHDHGETWHGKVLDTDKWRDVEWITFRKGLVVLKKVP